MGIINDIKEALKEIPISDILRERLAESEKAIEKLEKENTSLKIENADLKRRNNELLQESTKNKVTANEFVEARGALFKRKPDGSFHETVYCPGCKMPLSSFGGDFPYSCDRCGIHLDLFLHDVPAIMKELA